MNDKEIRERQNLECEALEAIFMVNRPLYIYIFIYLNHYNINISVCKHLLSLFCKILKLHL